MRYALVFIVMAIAAIAIFNSNKSAVAQQAECLQKQRSAQIDALVRGDDPRAAIAESVPCNGLGGIER